MSYLNQALQGKKVLVTGATGFIGGRLAQRLAEEEGAIVTGTGRTLQKAAYLRDAGVDLQEADLQNSAAMGALVQGQDVVFHVAAWLVRRGNEDQAYPLNVTAVESLVQQAASAGVRRFVHVSSIAAYGVPTADAPVYEDAPLDTQQEELYGRTKATGDLRAQELADELGLELTVIRPGMVYGPRAMGWSVGMLKLVQSGTPVIFGDGSGHAYPVYIDNLIDGMMLTAVHPAAAGEAFNFCDPVITLKQFFTYYGEMCGKKPRRLPLWAANILVAVNALFRLNLPVNRQRVKRFAIKADYPSDKAANLLGYTPRVPVDEGMKRTEAWLRAEGYLQ